MSGQTMVVLKSQDPSPQPRDKGRVAAPQRITGLCRALERMTIVRFRLDLELCEDGDFGKRQIGTDIERLLEDSGICGGGYEVLISSTALALEVDVEVTSRELHVRSFGGTGGFHT